MSKYIWYTYKHLLVVILIDLILLVSILNIGYITELQTQFENYYSLGELMMLGANIQTIMFRLVYRLILSIQYPLALAITGYLLTGRRFSNSLKIIGKPKTIRFQAGLLFTSLIIALYTSQFVHTPSFFNYNYNLIAWLVLSGGLVTYHLLFFSNIKYADLVPKISIPVFVALSFGALHYLCQLTLGATYSLNYWQITYLTSYLNAVSQITIPAITPNITLLFNLAVYTLLICGVSLVEIKKVGQS